MKRRLLTALLAAMFTLASANASASNELSAALKDKVPKALRGKLSANVDYATDYRFRGLSQTNKNFAIQGGFDYNTNAGFYLGTWASNVNAASGFTASEAELDLYGGYGFNLTDTTALDLNVLYYYYPGASSAGSRPDINFIEYTPTLSYSNNGLNASFGVSYSPDYFFGSGTSFYYNATASYKLFPFLTAGAHVGYQDLDDNQQFGTPSYADWSVSLSTTQFGLGWKVAYVDTDIDQNECFGGSNLCDATVVGTLSKSF